MSSHGYYGPGAENIAKKNMLKRLRKKLDESALSKVMDKARQKKQLKDSQGVSSINPTYPGFKEPK